MDQINKAKSISIWIFIIPFITINACLLLMSSGNFGLLDLDEIKKYMNNER